MIGYPTSFRDGPKHQPTDASKLPTEHPDPGSTLTRRPGMTSALRVRRIAMAAIGPQLRSGFLNRLDVEIDRDRLAVAAHQHAFQHLITAGVGLLMRHVRGNKNEVPGVGTRRT